MSLFNDKKIFDLETKILRLEERIIDLESRINLDNTKSGRINSLHGASLLQEPEQREDIGFNPILHKEQPLVDSGTGFFDCRDRNLASYLGTNTKT